MNREALNVEVESFVYDLNGSGKVEKATPHENTGENQPYSRNEKSRAMIHTAKYYSRGGSDKRRKHLSNSVKTSTQTPSSDGPDKNNGYNYRYNSFRRKIKQYLINLSKDDVVEFIIGFLETPDSELYRR